MNQTEAVVVTQGGIYERPVDYLPERDVYESLCRGEGIKLVRCVWAPSANLGLGCGCGEADLGRMCLCS